MKLHLWQKTLSGSGNCDLTKTDRRLNDKARFVNDAITAKKVAFKFAGARFAIQASMGIIEI